MHQPSAVELTGRSKQRFLSEADIAQHIAIVSQQQNRRLFRIARSILERIARDWNRGAIPRAPWQRVNPLGQTKQSVFTQPEQALVDAAEAEHVVNDDPEAGRRLPLSCCTGLAGQNAHPAIPLHALIACRLAVFSDPRPAGSTPTPSPLERARNQARRSRKGTVAMKRLHAAALGALLLSAPAIAMAGNGSGGGGLAGVVSQPVTAAFSGPSANQSGITIARTGAAPYTDASGGTPALTGTYQSQPGSNVLPNGNATSIVNRMGGGR